jgi:hypothetical protein
VFNRVEARLPKIVKEWHEPLYPELGMIRRMRAEAAALLGVPPLKEQGDAKLEPARGPTGRLSELR